MAELMRRRLRSSFPACSSTRQGVGRSSSCTVRSIRKELFVWIEDHIDPWSCIHHVDPLFGSPARGMASLS